MKRYSSMIRLAVLTCIFLVCFGSILWYMRAQKLAETENTPAGSEQTLTPTAAPTISPTTAPTVSPADEGNSSSGASADNDATPEPTGSENTVQQEAAKPTDSVTQDDHAADESEDTAQSSPDDVKEDASVTLCLAGDLMCLAGQQYAAERADGSHDYTGSFTLVQEYLQDCDFVIGNLETVLSESSPYTTELKEVAAGCPNCNAPADYLASLKAAGFTTLVTCNNHSLDGGVTGINETLQHLAEYEFAYTGTYPDSAGETEITDRFLILEKDGIKIGLVAFTELVNLRDSLPASELEQIINCYSQSFAKELIAAARAAGADYIIAYNHWGSENTHEVRDYQRVHAKELAEAGADLIIGSHPHCLQEYELLETADGRLVSCYYSLGNLVSSMTRDINNDTVLLTVTLQRTNGVLQSESVIHACHVFGYLDGSAHVIVPVSYPLEREEQQTTLQDAALRISEILQ